MMVVTFSYAAFNTELIITGDALIEAIKEETLATYVDSLVKKSDDVVTLGNATRYVGSNPNNYVFYNGELWRIIGVFDVNTPNGPERLTKIMKPDPVELLSYNSAYYTNNNNGKNDFYDSTIYNYLFKNYYYKSYDQYNMYQCVNGSSMASTSCAYKGLSVNSASMVEKVYWNLGSTNPYEIGRSNVFTPDFLYQSENGSATPRVCQLNWNNGSRCNENDSRHSSVLTYVGLMYPSDIGYAAGTVCSSNNYGDSCYASAWTSAPGPEWTISPAYSTNYGDTVIAMYQGQLWSQPASNAFGIRPTLYLKEEVKKAGGTGTQSDPYLLKYNGPIGIEPGVTNYAPQGDPVNNDDPDDPDDPNNSHIINPDVHVNVSVEEITSWTGHYKFGFTINNTTDTDMNEWTVYFKFNPKVTVNVAGSNLPNRVTGVLTAKQMKINNENKYYAPNPDRIPVGGSYDSNNDGILLLTFNPDEVSIDDIITEITVYNISEKFE